MLETHARSTATLKFFHRPKPSTVATSPRVAVMIAVHKATNMGTTKSSNTALLAPNITRRGPTSRCVVTFQKVHMSTAWYECSTSPTGHVCTEALRTSCVRTSQRSTTWQHHHRHHILHNSMRYTSAGVLSLLPQLKQLFLILSSTAQQFSARLKTLVNPEYTHD